MGTGHTAPPLYAERIGGLHGYQPGDVETEALVFELAGSVPEVFARQRSPWHEDSLDFLDSWSP
jgi:hypothetical protein